MKNQNDLIISIVAIVFFLIIGGVAYGTKKEPVQPGKPEVVNLAEPAYPSGVVPVMANALPTGSNSQTGGGGGGGAALGGGAGLKGAARGGGNAGPSGPADRPMKAAASGAGSG